MTLAEINEQLPACFGLSDNIFSGHPADIERARQVLNLYWENDFSFEEFLRSIDRHLTNLGCSPVTSTHK